MMRGHLCLTFQQGFHTDNVSYLSDEERIDSGCGHDLIDRLAQAKQLRNGIDPVIRADGNVIQQLLLTPLVKLLHVQVMNTDFQRPDAF